MCIAIIAMIHYVISGLLVIEFFLFKQKTAYEMRISDWSSDVCSSDLPAVLPGRGAHPRRPGLHARHPPRPLLGGTGGRDLAAPRCRRPGRRPQPDRKSVAPGKSESVRVDHGGRRTITTITPLRATPHLIQYPFILNTATYANTH